MQREQLFSLLHCSVQRCSTPPHPCASREYSLTAGSGQSDRSEPQSALSAFARMPQLFIKCRWTRAHGYSEYSHRATSVRQWDAHHYGSAVGRGRTERHWCEQSHARARGRYSRVLTYSSATYLGRRQVAQPWHLTPSMRAAVGRCSSRLAQAPLRIAKRQRAPRRNAFAPRGHALRGGAMGCTVLQRVALRNKVVALELRGIVRPIINDAAMHTSKHENGPWADGTDSSSPGVARTVGRTYA
jgi:hypothetical protein